MLSLEVVSGFEVTRRILVDMEGISLRRKWLAGLEPENVHMMIGKSNAGECLRKSRSWNFLDFEEFLFHC